MKQILQLVTYDQNNALQAINESNEPIFTFRCDVSPVWAEKAPSTEHRVHENDDGKTKKHHVARQRGGSPGPVRRDTMKNPTHSFSGW